MDLFTIGVDQELGRESLCCFFLLPSSSFFFSILTTDHPPPKAIDPKVILQLMERVQAHVRQSHLLVDQATVVTVEQMRDLEQQCAHTIVAFTRLISSSNAEMQLIGRAADELSAETKRSYDRIAELVELTMKVRDCLPLEERKQVDGGSALYRAAFDQESMAAANNGDSPKSSTDSNAHNLEESPRKSPLAKGRSDSPRIRSGSAVAALKHLHFRSTGDSAQLLDEYNDEALVKLWLDDLLPRWDQPGDAKRRIAAARKGKGIPPSIRGAIWKRAIGNHLEITVAQFEQLCKPSDGEDERTVSLDLIRHDLPRTFHRLQLFGNSTESFSVDLVKVLEAFARLNGDLGYVQGMSYLAGMLLLNMGAYDAWVAMNNLIVDNHFFVSLFRMNVPGIVQHARIYEMVLSENSPSIYSKLHDLGVTSDHYLLDWFMTVFTRKLPIRICTRVWDLFLVTGEIFLHKTAVAVMKIHKRTLMECDFEECVKELSAPIESMDEDEFMSIIDSVKVNQHWSGILERFHRKSSPIISSRKEKDLEDE